MSELLRTVLARLRQIQALDKNAEAIYADLSQRLKGSEFSDKLEAVVADEQRHQAMIKGLVESLETSPQEDAEDVG